MSVYDPGPAFTIGEWEFDSYHAGRRHAGIDFLAPVGTPIPAAAAGIVVALGFEKMYGNMIIIRHTGITEPPYRYTLYAHMEHTLPVSIGSEVSRGQTIGYVDSTGDGGGETPHLHFELVSLSEADGTWESKWGKYIGEAETTWGANTSRPLMLTSMQGRLDPLAHASWEGIDVYFPPPNLRKCGS